MPGRRCCGFSGEMPWGRPAWTAQPRRSTQGECWYLHGTAVLVRCCRGGAHAWWEVVGGSCSSASKRRRTSCLPNRVVLQRTSAQSGDKLVWVICNKRVRALLHNRRSRSVRSTPSFSSSANYQFRLIETNMKWRHIRYILQIYDQV